MAAAITAGAVLLLAAVTALVLGRDMARLPAPDAAGASIDRTGAAYLSPAANLARPVYRYSVVPGGVYSRDEVRRAMAVDPVVAAHYAGLDVASLRVERLDAPRWAHVSYRVDDAVYWTAKQLLLGAGELVLTDGERMIRARCGNSISTVSLDPLHDDEPVADEFDRLGDPVMLAALPPADPGMPVGSFDPLVVPSPEFPVFIGTGEEDEEDPEDPPNDPPGDDPPPPPPPPPPPGDPPVPVPEPSTLLLVGAGAGAGLWRHLRNRRARE